MNRLFRSNFSTSSRSSIPFFIPEIPQEDGVINSEDYQLSDVDLKLGDWNILDFSVHLHDPHVMKALTLNIKTDGTLMVQGTNQISMIYRVYYKCMRTNFNVQALNKKRLGETTLIQTIDPRSNIQVPKTLQWSEVTFLENQTLENEKYPLQIQNPSQNPDLDFVQQLSNGTIRLSFDQSRFRFPPAFEDPRFRSPINLPQPSRQPPIPLIDRPASQCSSSRPRVPFPRSRRDLGLDLQGVRT